MRLVATSSSLAGLVIQLSLVNFARPEFAVKHNASDNMRYFPNQLPGDGWDEDNAKAIFYIRRGKPICTGLHCQQGTIYYQNRVCKCICRKNYALYKSARCIRASWSSWSSWSKCLKSDWGGLQHRQRICKAVGKEFPGSCPGRGSMAKTCTAITKEFKIRKNVRDLTKEEYHDLLQAMTKFKKDKSKKGFRNIVSWHGYPGRCPWYHHIKDHSNNHCSWHHHPMFQPWHRMIIVQFELGLSRYLKNKTLGIPYWDWTEHADDIPYLLRGPKTYDPVLKKFITNPFYRSFIDYFGGVKMYSQRKPLYSGLLMSRYILKGTVRAMMLHNYYNYDEQQSSVPHDQIHDCFCTGKILMGQDVCGYGMPSIDNSAYDPAFLLHHSAMDRLFVIRRKLEEVHGVADWTKSRVIGQYLKGQGYDGKDVKKAFDWPLSPFCNKSMNPEIVTGRKRVWTMHNAYYNEQLFGYKYDNFNFGHNYKWEDLQRDFKRSVIDRKFWNDDLSVTKLGDLTKANSMSLPMLGSTACTVKYSNPVWHMHIGWN